MPNYCMHLRSALSSKDPLYITSWFHALYIWYWEYDKYDVISKFENGLDPRFIGGSAKDLVHIGDSSPQLAPIQVFMRDMLSWFVTAFCEIFYTYLFSGHDIFIPKKRMVWFVQGFQWEDKQILWLPQFSDVPLFTISSLRAPHLPPPVND